MTEEQTLTMDESPADQGQFTDEEMDSLAVGEEMVKQQENLLAGKYKNAQELEKAHIELQRKLGKRDDTEDTSTEEPVEEERPVEEKEEPESSNVLEALWDQRNNENGFSEETLKELAKTNPGELAKVYLRYRNEVAKQQAAQEPKGLTDNDINQLKQVAGGDEQYKQILTWAGDNLSKEEQDMYDTVIDRGDPLACYFALQALMGRYRDESGDDGRLLQGKPPTSSGNQFRSQAELVAAMGDPRYDRDPAYRREVQEKLERSNINF